ncbi:MAG TPA: copper resistance protein CopC [Miltoncostaeaceae bacterium]|nr:copper resistance protein CopC [Miltoncostaeaceae bacterium]
MTTPRRARVRSAHACRARTPLRRAAVPAALALVLGGTGTALAHSEATGTRPADGATLAAAPAQVVVTYGEPLLEVVSGEVTVAGRPVSGRARLAPGDRRRLVIPLTDHPAGAYRVSWTVVGPDTHRVAGSATFTVRGTPMPATLRRLQARVRDTGAAIAQAATGWGEAEGR